MKKFFKKIIIIPGIFFIIVAAALFATDSFVMPWYVEAGEVMVPDLVGKNKIEAINILKGLGLNPIEEGPRYDERFEKDRVIYHNPRAGVKVKDKRRVYLFVSGGDPLIKMPRMIGKTFRDAKVTIERLGLELGEAEEARSELPANTIIEQDIEEGENIPKGSIVNLKVSVGPKVGMIRVPNLLGKSIKQAEGILRRHSLRFGKKVYINSPNLLPNTVIDQYPSENKLLSYGDSVDVTITQNK